VIGTLVLVATPIGHLGDLSPRAVDTLAAADLVCCEDTRHSGKLLARAGVRASRLAVVNDHTETARTTEVLDVLAGGGTVAVITDAGTPGISDPGARLVVAAIGAGAMVSAVPGPAAVVMALVVSGFDTTRFVFEGFLPRSGRARGARLAELAAERRTTIVYEAPHRIARTVDDLAGVCGGDRRIALCRELTKLHEEVWRGSLADAVEQPIVTQPRGEYVLVVEGASAPPAATTDDLLADLRDEITRTGDRKAAIAAVALRHQVPKRTVYDLALTIE
jgi:16S rRNA (cytidine1402-2'-O)-methyltransferase